MKTWQIIRMKLQYRLTLPIQSSQGSDTFKSASAEMKDALAELMLDAYIGTVDYEGEGLQEAKEEIGNLLGGVYGTFLADHSYALWDKNVLVSATLVTLMKERPLLAFSMTRSDFKRHGYARRLITATANSLWESGYSSLDLWVTDSNEPAIKLYEELGFQIV